MAVALVATIVLLCCAACGARVEPTRSTAPVEPTRSTPAPASPDASRAAAQLPRDAIDGMLAFSAETPDGDEDVFVIDLGPSGGERRRLTERPVREFDPDLSPDGSRIAFRVNPDAGSDAADIWVMNVDGTDARNLTGDPSLDNWSPAWSPDGRRIAFASSRDGGTLSVWTMAPDGTDLRRITSRHGEYPDWAPDGSRLVYAAPRSAGSGTYDLWIVDANGAGTPEPLTGGPGHRVRAGLVAGRGVDRVPAGRGDRWELWIVRPDGSDAQRVSPDGEDGVWPAWSPGGLLAWSGTQGLSFVDLETGARRSIRPAQPGTDFLSWVR